MNMTPFLSVVVPCFNEADGLVEFYKRISAACAPYTDQGYEIILVNDGSSDQTWPVIQSLVYQDPHIVGVCLSRNFGHSMALSAGLDHCRGQRVMVIDADLQDPPELLGEMMAALDQGADVAYGKRTLRQGETWFKETSASLFYRLINLLSDTDMPRDTGDFRLMNRRVTDVLLGMPETSRYIRGMVAWVGFNQVAIPYVRKARFAGDTHYTLAKMINFAVAAITSFSTKPLRLAVYLGFLMLLAGVGLLAYIAVSFLSGQTVHGWTSLAFIIVILQSVQFLILGLLGEYVGRIYQECKQRPRYIIKDLVRK